MRWTAENDQLLFLRILQTHDFTVDTKRVAAAWPVPEGAKGPTPRAIAERLVKLRQAARDSGGVEGHFSIGKGIKKASPATTPRKPRKAATAATPGSGKRKRGAAKKDSDEEESAVSTMSPTLSSPAAVEPETPTKGKGKGKSVSKLPVRPAVAGNSSQVRAVAEQREVFVVDENKEEKNEEEAGSPAKRARKPSALHPGMVTWNDDDEQEEISSSASEYVPEPEVEVKGEEVDVEDFEYV
ncbi:hypothetical protein BO78DRAFT_431850 [Aspergillus sclerotiicarbonarius CBS 121057]|uniref:Uncharacterized protein n=1 Tax=Aspergillus sclerotiicarbonarius (strain CBS 121057 / IBT 28362) TaxID=1448318 RepID=A0A319E1D4_ASPSB|nr:hypothetical protein BO78DRAFT_431850 [Aspergillus sclerotiicarbonarius CBS 121057]